MFIKICMASVALIITVINESELIAAEQLFNSFNIKQFNSLLTAPAVTITILISHWLKYFSRKATRGTAKQTTLIHMILRCREIAILTPCHTVYAEGIHTGDKGQFNVTDHNGHEQWFRDG